MAYYPRPAYQAEGVQYETYSTIFNTEGKTPLPDYPITPLENFKLAAERKTPLWMPNASLDFISLQSQALTSGAMTLPPWGSPERGDFVDEWGVLWEYLPDAFGAIEKPGARPVLTDITKWEKQVVFPDLAAIDFKTQAEAFMKDRYKPGKVLQINLRKGCTERICALAGGYTQALVMMAEEPQAAKDFFAAFGEWYIEFFDRLYAYYPINLISYQDDWGTERDTFFSPKMLEEQVLEPTRKLISHIKEKGIYFMLHSCGKIERFVPYMIDLGIDFLQIQRRANDMPKLKQDYGDKIGFDLMLEGYDYMPDVPLESYLEAIRRTVDIYGRYGGALLSIGGPENEQTWAGIFELYCYSREYYDKEREQGLALSV